MRQTQSGAGMVHEFENLPRPTVWSWIGRQFDKLELLKRDQGIQEALTPLLAAAAPQFIRDFAAYDDREMALAGACETLLRLAYATVVGAGPTREAYELHWAQDTGKNWKQATEFPDRLVAMANEIEHRKAKGEIEGMNASLLLGSPRYADLAAEMRRYARFLVRRIEKIHARPRRYTKPILYLTYAIKEWTGKYRDRMVADLLNAIAAALKMGRSYDPLDLVQARSRHKKTRRT